MNKLCLFLLPLLFSSCVSYKLTRLYEPEKTGETVSNIELIIDSASVENAMFQNRLHLEFVSENKETGSTLYSYLYFKPERWLNDYGRNGFNFGNYENSYILNDSVFNLFFAHNLLNSDTLLYARGITGVEDYSNLTGNTWKKVRGISENPDYDLVSIVPTFKYPKTFTNYTVAKLQTNKYYDLEGWYVYNDYDLRAYDMANTIYSAIQASKKEKDDLLVLHSIGKELTNEIKGDDIILINEYSCDALFSVTDAFKLINDYAQKEIISMIDLNGPNDVGHIEVRISDKQLYGGFHWFILSTATVYLVNLVGFPIYSQYVDMDMEITLYNKEQMPIKTYTSSASKRSFSAMYWGYSFAGAAHIWSPNSMNRTVNSKAIHSALEDLKEQITLDYK